MPNAVIVDTNVLIHDPEAINTLREGGNTLFIPWTVWTELDNLKTKPDIGPDARECIRRIEEIFTAGDPSLVIWKKTSFDGSNDFLDRKNPDHRIIAAAISVKKENSKSTNSGSKNSRKKSEFEKFKFLSRDTFVRVTAGIIDGNGLLVENYNHNRVEVESVRGFRRTIVASEDFCGKDTIRYDPEKHGDLCENEGVICQFVGGIDDFAAIREGDCLKVISDDVVVFGIRPKPLHNGEKNWSQYIALRQLLNPKIKLVFLEGGAGTGKTLLALACALEQRRLYTQIAVTRPMVHLEDVDKMGFMPGGIEEKMAPWLRPLWASLEFLSEFPVVQAEAIDEHVTAKAKRSNRKNKKESSDIVSSKNYYERGMNRKSIIEKLRSDNKIIVEPLSYIRGMSYNRALIIVDEGQNTSPHVIKTIITRAGEDSKIIITGDLSQIDIRWLDKNSSGLAYAMARMKDDSLVATTYFGNGDSVRSPLTRLALERL